MPRNPKDPSDAAMRNAILNRYRDLNFVKRIQYPDRSMSLPDYEDESTMSHKMGYATGDRGEAYVYPEVVQYPWMNRLTQLDGREAADYAFNSGEYIPFANEGQAAWFSENYKTPEFLNTYKMGGKMKKRKKKIVVPQPYRYGGYLPQFDLGGPPTDDPQLQFQGNVNNTLGWMPGAAQSITSTPQGQGWHPPLVTDQQKMFNPTNFNNPMTSGNAFNPDIKGTETTTDGGKDKGDGWGSKHIKPMGGTFKLGDAIAASIGTANMLMPTEENHPAYHQPKYGAYNPFPTGTGSQALSENGGALYASGGGIHINPKNKGKFNATKKRTGKTTEELTHSSNPVTKKRAIFAQNARKWKHETGGMLEQYAPGGEFKKKISYETLTSADGRKQYLPKFEGDWTKSEIRDYWQNIPEKASDGNDIIRGQAWQDMQGNMAQYDYSRRRGVPEQLRPQESIATLTSRASSLPTAGSTQTAPSPRPVSSFAPTFTAADLASPTPATYAPGYRPSESISPLSAQSSRSLQTGMSSRPTPTMRGVPSPDMNFPVEPAPTGPYEEQRAQESIVGISPAGAGPLPINTGTRPLPTERATRPFSFTPTPSPVAATSRPTPRPVAKPKPAVQYKPESFWTDHSQDSKGSFGSGWNATAYLKHQMGMPVGIGRNTFTPRERADIYYMLQDARNQRGEANQGGTGYNNYMGIGNPTTDKLITDLANGQGKLTGSAVGAVNSTYNVASTLGRGNYVYNDNPNSPNRGQYVYTDDYNFVNDATNMSTGKNMRDEAGYKNMRNAAGQQSLKQGVRTGKNEVKLNPIRFSVYPKDTVGYPRYRPMTKRREDGGELYAGGGGLSRGDDYGSKSRPYPSVSSGDFAGGGRSYPIPTRADAVDALRLAGLHGRDDVKAKVYARYPDLRHENGGDMQYEDGSGIRPAVSYNPNYPYMNPTITGGTPADTAQYMRGYYDQYDYSQLPDQYRGDWRTEMNEIAPYSPGDENTNLYRGREEGARNAARRTSGLDIGVNQILQQQGPLNPKILKQYGIKKNGGKLESYADGGSFGKAFAAARKAKGAGQTFDWNGKSYTTDYKGETRVPQTIAPLQGSIGAAGTNTMVTPDRPPMNDEILPFYGNTAEAGPQMRQVPSFNYQPTQRDNFWRRAGQKIGDVRENIHDRIQGFLHPHAAQAVAAIAPEAASPALSNYAPHGFDVAPIRPRGLEEAALAEAQRRAAIIAPPSGATASSPIVYKKPTAKKKTATQPKSSTGFRAGILPTITPLLPQGAQTFNPVTGRQERAMTFPTTDIPYLRNDRVSPEYAYWPKPKTVQESQKYTTALYNAKWEERKRQEAAAKAAANKRTVSKPKLTMYGMSQYMPGLGLYNQQEGAQYDAGGSLSMGQEIELTPEQKAYYESLGYQFE